MDPRNDTQPLGIIAGGGTLPLRIAQECRRQNISCVIALADQNNDADIYKDFPTQIFKIGDIAKVIAYFRSYRATKLTFAGKIIRPNLKSIKVDIQGAKLLAKILKNKFLGDDKILRVVNEFFLNEGFKVIDPYTIIPKESGDIVSLSTKLSPQQQDKIDIEIGINAIRIIGSLDIGQAVIVESGYILGVEAAEGTDNLVRRCSILRNQDSGGVLVKALKPNQNKAMDRPAMGIETIRNVADSRYNGIAIDNNTIIIDPIECYKLADELRIFIIKV